MSTIAPSVLRKSRKKLGKHKERARRRAEMKNVKAIIDLYCPVASISDAIPANHDGSSPNERRQAQLEAASLSSLPGLPFGLLRRRQLPGFLRSFECKERVREASGDLF